jgi:hypothetical protein
MCVSVARSVLYGRLCDNNRAKIKSPFGKPGVSISATGLSTHHTISNIKGQPNYAHIYHDLRRSSLSYVRAASFTAVAAEVQRTATPESATRALQKEAASQRLQLLPRQSPKSLP